MSTQETRKLHPLETATDEDLALQASAGSVTAFSELLDRYERRVFNFVLRRIPCPADAEDITQETSVRAWQRIGQYNRHWRFSTWLFTIASRLTINHLRALARRRRTESTARPTTAGDGDDDDPSSAVDQRESCRHIWEVAAEVLPSDQHAALWLRYAEDLSMREIARIMGRTTVGARVLLFRARQSLAEYLQEAENRPVRDAAGDEATPARPLWNRPITTGGV